MQVQNLLILSILLNPFTQPVITIKAKIEAAHKRYMSVFMWIVECIQAWIPLPYCHDQHFFLYLASRPRVLLVNTPKQESKYQSTFPSATQSLTPLTQHANFSRKYAWLFQFYLMLQCINKRYVSAYLFFQRKKRIIRMLYNVWRWGIFKYSNPSAKYHAKLFFLIKKNPSHASNFSPLLYNYRFPFITTLYKFAIESIVLIATFVLLHMDSVIWSSFA